MNLTRRFFRLLGFILYTTFISLVVLEIFFRVLPVSQSLETQEVSAESPFLHFKENKSTRIQMGFNFQNVINKRSNNYGYLTDVKFLKKENRDNKEVVAIIGDSFVEAIQVSNEDTFHGQLSGLNNQFDFYPIGSSGSSLAQYVAYAKFASIHFTPSAYIFMICSDDFLYSFKGRANNPGFHYFSDEGHMSRIDYKPSYFKTLARNSAFIRYIVLDLGLIARLNTIFNSSVQTQKIEIPVFLREQYTKADEEEIKKATKYFIHNLVSIIGNTPALLVFDSDRPSIYNNLKTRNMKQLFNKAFVFLNDEAKKHQEIDVLDLHPYFNGIWEERRERFDYVDDPHWNKLGHRLVAEALQNSLFLKKIYGSP